MGLPLSNCTGQCHDGASNMSGAKGRVTAQLTAIESLALYTYCYCHALNLSIADIIELSKVCHNALKNAFEITKLINFSPKEMQFLIEFGQKMEI